MNKHHAYIITWQDSAAYHGWTRVDDHFHGEVGVITSIGWLVKQTPKVVTITTSISNGGRVMDALSIPRAAITKMTKLPRHIVNATI